MTTDPARAVRMLLALLAAAVVGLGVLSECRGDALAGPIAPEPPPTPVVTPYPWLTPMPVGACGIAAYWFVAPERTVNVFGRPVQSAGRWEWRWTLEGGTLLQPVGIQMPGSDEYLIDVIGPTATVWPTVEPDTPTPSPVPSQTPWVVVVTATAPATATEAPTRAVWVPVVLRHDDNSSPGRRWRRAVSIVNPS